MRKRILVCICCVLLLAESHAQLNEWAWLKGDRTAKFSSNATPVYGTILVPSTGNRPGIRQNSATWTDASGNLWLFGGQGQATDQIGNLNDLWRYNPATNEWTWMKGSNTANSTPVYGQQNVPNINNVPGALSGSVTWVDATGKFWMFGGSGNVTPSFAGLLNDVWMYDPVTNMWTWKRGDQNINSISVGGTSEEYNLAFNPGGTEKAGGWVDAAGVFWMFGGNGRGLNNGLGPLNDIWKFDPGLNQWAWVKGARQNISYTEFGTIGIPSEDNMPGGREHMSCWKAPDGKFWIFGGYGFLGFDANLELNDLWRFDPLTSDWTWMHGDASSPQANYGTLGVPDVLNKPGGRTAAAEWTDAAGNFWLFGGNGFGASSSFYGNLNDRWKYDIATGRWTWMGGSNNIDQLSEYGTQNVFGSQNTPGARYSTNVWKDGSGNFWLHGGFSQSLLNELWKFNPTTNQWAWVRDDNSSSSYFPSNYGVIGVPHTQNNPGGRQAAGTWATGTNDFLVFGGEGRGGLASGKLNDLWKYSRATNNWTWIKGDSLIDKLGVYGTLSNPSSSNNPGGRSSSASWKDVTGKMFLFGGSGMGNSAKGQLNDLWRYDEQAGHWTWIKGDSSVNKHAIYSGVAAAIMPGGRSWAAQWTTQSGVTFLFGGQGYAGSGNSGYLNELWKYDPGSNNWTFIKGDNSTNAIGIYGNRGIPNSANKPGARDRTNTWIDANGDLWLFGGYGYGRIDSVGFLNDVWKFNVSTNNWTWMSGTPEPDQNSTRGTLGVPGINNTPGGRLGCTTWSDGNILWFSSGFTAIGWMNDVWKYNTITNQWSWIGGSSGADNAGTYGPSGVSNPSFIPGSRYKASGWKVGTTELWMFGGTGYGESNQSGPLNDVWLYKLPCSGEIFISPVESAFCFDGNPVTLTATGGTGYSWFLDGSPISGAFNNTYIATSPGSYSVKGTVGGCPDVFSNEARVQTPTVEPFLGGGGVYCTGAPVSVGMPDTENEQDYLWLKGGIGGAVANYVPIGGGGGNQSLNFLMDATRSGTYIVETSKPGCDTVYSNYVYIGFAEVKNLKIDKLCPNSVDFSWDPVLPVPQPQSYQYEVSENPFPPANGTTSTTSSGTATLLPSKNYYLHVRVACGSGFTNFGEWETLPFTTGAVPIVTLTPPVSNICSSQSVTLTASGGSTYQWFRDNALIPGESGSTYSTNIPGTYRVHAFVGNCQTAFPSSNVTINVSAAPTGSISPASGSICPGGSITLTANGGTSYQWFKDGASQGPAAPSPTFSANATGIYSVTIYNGTCNGPASNTVEITASATPTGTISPASGSICPGGSITLTANGGTSYQWFKDGVSQGPAAPSPTFSASATGTYSVTIFNGTCNGPASNTSVITASATPTGTISPASGSICPGGNITLTATGGTSYQWFKDGVSQGPAAPSPTFSASATGTYSVTIFNGTCNGPASNTSVITASATPTGTISPASGSICPGGSITLTANGGTSYQWFKDGISQGPAAPSPTFSANATGTYSVTIFNGTCNGPASNTSVITASATPTGTISPASGSICPGGSITLTANGGTSYQWFKDGVSQGPAAPSPTFSASATGIYSVTIYNGTCSGPASNNSVITASATPTGTISPASGSICPGGSITLTANGGTSYQWFKDGVSQGPAAPSPTFSASATGIYSVTIFNGTCNGPASNTSVITASATPTGAISPATGSICPGESITLTASGGTTYEWFRNGISQGPASASATFSASTSGFYTVMIFNGSCSGPASNAVEITVKPLPSGTISPSTGTICPGGSITLQANGGSLYEWFLNGVSQGAPSASSLFVALAAGSYSVQITENSCTAPASNQAILTAGSLPIGSINPPAATICAGGIQIFTATGGSAYEWFLNGVSQGPSSPTATFNAVSAGTYTVQITNGGCSGPASNSAILNVTALPTGTITPQTATICQGFSQLFTATGGSSYEWFLNGVSQGPSSASATFNATVAGTYSVIITASGCPGPAANVAVLNVTPLPTGTITPLNPAICAGSSQLLTATGGDLYEWFINGVSQGPASAASTFNATVAGTYSVMLTKSDCSAPAANTTQVTITPQPVGGITPATATICAGSSQLLTANGGTTYEWFINGVSQGAPTATATFNATAAGNYTVKIYKDNCSASGSNSSLISVTSLPVGNIMPATVAICAGKSTLLKANGGTSYEWFINGISQGAATASDEFTATIAGTYTVKISSNNCSALATNASVVTVNPLPTGSVSPATATICPGATQLFTANGGVSYTWFKDNVLIAGAVLPDYSASDPGTYRTEITDINGCKNMSVFSTLNHYSKPKASFTYASFCEKQPVTFVNTSTSVNSGGVGYSWNFGDNGVSALVTPVHTYLQSGDFNIVLIATSATCPLLADTLKQTVKINPAIPGIRYPNVRVVKNITAQLSARNIGNQFSWQPPGGLTNPLIREPLVKIADDQQYTIRIVSNGGCISIDTVLVQAFTKSDVFVPKAFTPNSNNNNDLLRPLLVNIPEILYFRVYNRWGQIVFQTTTPGDGWNGIYRNSPQPMETYTWVFEGRDADGNIIKANGKSLLIR